MNYKLQSCTPGRVELRRSRVGQYVLGAVLGVLGVPTALVGGLIALADPGLGALVAGFGLAFSGATLLVVTREVGPGAFAFDDQARALLAYRSPTARGEPEARMAYSQISELRVGRYESSSTDGRSVSFALDVVRRDGECWSLSTFHSQDKAEQLLALVQANLQLAPQPGDAGRPAEQPISSGRFHVERTPDQTRVRFKKPYRLVTHAGGLLVISGICLALFGARYQMPPFAFYIALGLLSFALAALLFGIVNGIGKHVVLLITQQNLRAQEEGGVIKAWFEEPIAALHAVRLGFRPNRDDRMLLLLKQHEYAALARFREGNESNPVKLALALMSARKLEVGELSLAQKLELEQLIEAEVERVSGKRLL